MEKLSFDHFLASCEALRVYLKGFFFEALLIAIFSAWLYF
jgi:hypothetical protein